MSSSYFEIVVVGTDLSGLILAAIAAKRGYRVLVVGQGQRKNTYEFDGYRFFRRPHLFHGLSASPAAEQVLVELGLNIEIRNLLQPIRPRYQFLTPSRRVDFDADPTILARELEREFPGQLAHVERYLRAVAEDNATVQTVLQDDPPLPPEGMRERRRFRRAAAELEHLLERGPLHGADPLAAFASDEPARGLLTAPLPFLGCPEPREMGYIPWVRAAVHAAQGFHVLHGGLDRLKDLFIDKVVAHCGSYRPEAFVDGLQIRFGKVRSVVMKRRDEEVGCKLVVCNGDPKRFFQLVPHEHQKERFHHAVRSLQPTHYLATLNFAIEGDVVQEGMCPVAFLVADERAPLTEENLIALTVDPKVHEEDGRVWRVATAGALISARRFSPRREFAAEVAEGMRARITRFVPFMDERLLASHLTWVPRTDDGEFDMSEAIPLYGHAVPDSFDASPMPAATGYRNILVGGDTLLSGFGLEGSFQAGLTLLRHAKRLVVLKSILHD